MGNTPKAITAGDFDGDNLIDLATANATDNTISLLLSKGDGTFESALHFRMRHREGTIQESLATLQRLEHQYRHQPKELRLKALRKELEGRIFETLEELQEAVK